MKVSHDRHENLQVNEYEEAGKTYKSAVVPCREKKKNQTNDEDMVMVTAAIYSHGSVNCNNAASFGRCNDIIYVNFTEN